MNTYIKHTTILMRSGFRKHWGFSIKTPMFAILLLVLISSPVSAGNLEDANEYFLTGQYAKAISSYESSLSTADAASKPQIYYNLAVCNEKIGNLERSLYYYKRAGGLKDAATQARRLKKKINGKKIARLKREAQSAYDAMNYGVAKTKAEEILKLEAGNTWALSFIESLGAETTTDDSLAAKTDSLQEASDTGNVHDSLMQAAASDTTVTDSSTKNSSSTETGNLARAGKLSIPLWILLLAALTVLLVAVLAFLIDRAGRKQDTQQSLRNLINLLPAGMLSIRTKDKLSLLFFEKGKVIKALVEESDGVKIGGRSVAEEILGPSCSYTDKGEGPWNKFADLMIDVYRRAEVEAAESVHKSVTRKKTIRKKK